MFRLNPFAKAFNPARPVKGLGETGVAQVLAFNSGDSFEGLIPILNAAQLLKPHAELLAQIYELAGLSSAAFGRFYQPAIDVFARYVQQLPASQIHHHAAKGGLLTHSLEVCVLALKIRRAYLLSAESGAEEIAKKQDLWTYAVFLAALCHDLAKPAAYQQVTIHSKPGSEPIAWQGYAGFMDEQGAYYRLSFVSGSVQGLHEKITPLLVHHIIPKDGMQWLSGDPLIFAQWLAAISNNTNANNETIRVIVAQADDQSVAKNLGGGNPLTSKNKPIAMPEKILTALRHLIASGVLPLNTEAGKGWLKGDDCWLASKVTADAIRVQLMSEAHSDTPALNGPLFEILQQNGVLLPCADKALWEITVIGEGWQHEITALKIPAIILWPNAAARPEGFTGEVHLKPEVAVFEDFPLADAPFEPEWAADDVITLEPEFQPEPEPQIEPDNEPVVLHNWENNAAESSLSNQPEGIAPVKVKLPPPEFKLPDTKGTASRVKAANNNLGTASGVPNLADDFIVWLHLSIQKQILLVNNAQAMLHVVDEGVFLATPGIFKCYAETHKLADWQLIQKTILKKRWHLTNAQDLNFFTYQVTGKQKSTRVNGLLFADPAFIFGSATIPKPNPHLMQIVEKKEK